MGEKVAGIEILRKNLSGEVYDVLREMILGGELKPGEKLPEEQLTVRLSVSRTPIRHAISALAQDDLVAIVPRRGAFVAQPSEHDVIEIYDVRMVLEGLAARLAIALNPEEDLEKMTDILKEAEAVLEDEPEQATKADAMLHELVLRNCGNSRLQKVIASLHDQMQMVRVFDEHQPEVLRQTIKELWDILNAFKERDAERAEELLMRHIQDVKERRLAQFPDETIGKGQE